MSGFTKLFGGSNTQQAAAPTMATGISIQSSVYGKCIPLIYGTSRQAGNLILYGNFETVPVFSQSGGGGGKGGLFGGNTGAQAQVTYYYFTSLAFALSEGSG